MLKTTLNDKLVFRESVKEKRETLMWEGNIDQLPLYVPPKDCVPWLGVIPITSTVQDDAQTTEPRQPGQ